MQWSKILGLLMHLFLFCVYIRLNLYEELIAQHIIAKYEIIMPCECREKNHNYV